MLFGRLSHFFNVIVVVSILLVDEVVRCEKYNGGEPHTSVIGLGIDSFSEAINDSANSFWLLKFYAPWCGHCKKMAPVLDKVAPVLKGKMAIGKIDCTVEKKLCNQYSVRGYPTLKYSIDGDVMDYPGSRDEDAIIRFAEKMSAPPITFVSSFEEVATFVKEKTDEGVAFVAYDKSSSKESPSALNQMFYKVARKKQASAYFLWIDTLSEEETPESDSFVYRVETGFKPKTWDSTEPAAEVLEEWVQAQNVPSVAMLGPGNFNRIGKNGRPLVVSVVDTANDEQTEAVKKHMIDYIDKTDPAKTEQYYYGMIDGKKWSRFLEQFRVLPDEIPQTIVLDVPTKKFWQNATYSNMFEFMQAVEDGTISPETPSASGGNGFLGKIERLFLEYFPYSLIVLLVMVFGLVFLLVPSPEARPPYENLEAHLDDLDEEPLPDISADDAKDSEPAESKKDK